MSYCTKYTKFSKIKITYKTSATDIATLPKLAFKIPIYFSYSICETRPNINETDHRFEM